MQMHVENAQVGKWESGTLRRDDIFPPAPFPAFSPAIPIHAVNQK